jgi:hypothetical protein
LEKSHSCGRDAAAEFLTSMDFLQHTNETITNSEQSPLSLFSPILYHMLWTLHSAKLPTICVKMLERHKNTKHKNTGNNNKISLSASWSAAQV